MNYDRFQPCGLDTVFKLQCPKCGRLLCQGNVIILVAKEGDVVGLIAESENGIECCGERQMAPKLFSTMGIAISYVNDGIQTGEVATWIVADTFSNPFLSTLKGFDVTEEALNRCLKSIIKNEPNLMKDFLQQKVRQVEAKPLKWDDLIERREQVVGKDIEFSTACGTQRGPIKALAIDKDKAVFALSWLALFDMNGGDGWVLQSTKGEDVRFAIWKNTTVVEDLGEGRIRLVLPSYEYLVIFTSHQNLNPKEVKGL